jgi:hypothetical protein
MRHIVQKALIAAAATLAIASAQATPVATWQTGGVFSNTASFVATGLTASNLSGTVPVAQQANGYVGYNLNAWSVYGSGAVANAAFTLTLTTSTALTLSTFDFSLFNNDCQVDGTPLNKCNTATWGVQMSVNGGGFGADLFSFNAGAPYDDNDYSVLLNQSLNAGDAVTMRVYAIDAGSMSPGTGQYYFHNISLNTPDSNQVPEPGTLALTGLALLAATRLRRKA